MQLHTLISLILAILVCGLAMWRGDRAARWVGAAFLASWLGSMLVYRRDPYHADYGILAIDAVTLMVFAWISMRTRRIWTIIASAFMAIIVASHVAVMIDLRVTLGTLFIGMAMWSYGVLACIAFGTWASRRGHARS
ncbi:MULTISPECIES: hypothetical protein [Caulobacter]|uniref:Uncharacterized protein n=1 Tax=Caulobacter rhizosphaerae TaxID=2010972 RepID=A0ABU1MXM8_9CAUL|nr:MULTISPECIES: hypothetical protein [Caulobacter]KQZ28548.1 hypothetical protein ASD47_21390 [Caulobacter sp. Root1472]MDR6530937.1 hypothetical protein [Caulobacter rhizosphaerae]GGL17253.1 hypothetical protein GCM10010983_13230 [Caulobacter rhizosphaerae]